MRFLYHTQRRATVGRTPLDEWSARRRDLYLTTHNTHNRQTSMSPAGFEPTISACEGPQTYAVDRAATGSGYNLKYTALNCIPCFAYVCNLVLSRRYLVIRQQGAKYDRQKATGWYRLLCYLFTYYLVLLGWQHFGEWAERGFSKHGVREETHRIKSYLTENKRRGHVWKGKERNRRFPKTLPLMFHRMWLLQL